MRETEAYSTTPSLPLRVLTPGRQARNLALGTAVRDD